MDLLRKHCQEHLHLQKNLLIIRIDDIRKFLFKTLPYEISGATFTISVRDKLYKTL